jgi:uncharacterized protein YlxW (UPF0749 family)
MDSKNELVNPVLYRYRRTRRDVVLLQESLVEERQRLQAEISNLQKQLNDITEELSQIQ